MNRRRLIWTGVWLVLFVITSAIVFGGGRSNGYGYWHGWGGMPGWGYMHNWDNDSSWRGHHFWQDDDEEDDAPGWRGYGMYPGWGMMQDYGGYGMGNYDWGSMHGYGMQGYGSWLPQDLDAAQQAKVKQLQDAAAAENRKLNQQRDAAHAKLQKLYASDKRDWAAIRTATNELMSVQAKLLAASIDLQQKIDAMLNDSQRKQ